MTEEPAQGAQVIDLMEALRASLEKKGGAKAAGPAAARIKPEPVKEAKEARKGPKRVVAAEPVQAKKARSKG